LHPIRNVYDDGDYRKKIWRSTTKQLTASRGRSRGLAGLDWLAIWFPCPMRSRSPLAFPGRRAFAFPCLGFEGRAASEASSRRRALLMRQTCPAANFANRQPCTRFPVRWQIGPSLPQMRALAPPCRYPASLRSILPVPHCTAPRKCTRFSCASL
jgi:hypothetical protein